MYFKRKTNIVTTMKRIHLFRPITDAKCSALVTLLTPSQTIRAEQLWEIEIAHLPDISWQGPKWVLWVSSILLKTISSHVVQLSTSCGKDKDPPVSKLWDEKWLTDTTGCVPVCTKVLSYDISLCSDCSRVWCPMILEGLQTWPQTASKYVCVLKNQK